MFLNRRSLIAIKYSTRVKTLELIMVDASYAIMVGASSMNKVNEPPNLIKHVRFLGV